jgi:signal transduction histidine kinase
VRLVHLGTLFLVLDLVVFSVVIWATGGPRSWLWPIYLLRVGDQMWLGRRRAAAMGLAGLVAYGGTLAWMAIGEGIPVPLSGEALKMAMLAAMGGYLIASSGLPWNLQERTNAAKKLILRLERQSLELDAERTRAEEASRTKTRFLAQMSHELRTPLNSVVGFAKLLTREGSELSEGSRERDYAERIHENALHLLAIISDILDIARIQEGGMEMTFSRVDLESLVREVVAEWEEEADPNVRVFLSFPRELRPLRADRARLRQVLENLVDNALKFTEEGWVRVEVLADPETSAARELRVVDTGIGIGPDHLEVVFDPFQQLDAGLSRRYEGTGLGLAVGKALCELMGFELDVESTPGEGSTFSILFQPALTPPASHPG